jgi:hypothetical protein
MQGRNQQQGMNWRQGERLQADAEGLNAMSHSLARAAAAACHFLPPWAGAAARASPCDFVCFFS